MLPLFSLHCINNNNNIIKGIKVKILHLNLVYTPSSPSSTAQAKNAHPHNGHPISCICPLQQGFAVFLFDVFIHIKIHMIQSTITF
jgi:hypothetical protein